MNKRHPYSQVVERKLEQLPGIIAVRLMERGAFARYNPNVISQDQICIAVRQAGYRASIFQDSKTGRTGRLPLRAPGHGRVSSQRDSGWS